MPVCLLTAHEKEDEEKVTSLQVPFAIRSIGQVKLDDKEDPKRPHSSRGRRKCIYSVICIVW